MEELNNTSSTNAPDAKPADTPVAESNNSTSSSQMANSVGSASPADSQDAAITHEKKRYPWLCLVGLLLCLAAWVACTKSGIATVALAAGSILFSAFSLGSHRAAVRNTAITVIVASGVLLLVVGAFMIVLHKLLG